MEIEKVFRRYNDILFRICLVQLCNEADAEDAVQDTFYRYMECKQAFRGEEHRKAWLIRVAVNICRDIQRKQRRQQTIDMEALGDYYETESDGRLLE